MRLFIAAPFLILSFILSGCGASVTPVLSTKPTHIVGANVTMFDIGATVNLPEDVRYKIAREATRYSNVGEAKTLKVNLLAFNVKNPLQSWLIGDANRIAAEVRVIDKKSGKIESSFEITHVTSGAIQGIAGAVLSAVDNPIDVEQELATGLAIKIFTRLYGPKKADAASEKKYREVAGPKYPRTYDSLKVEHKCKMAAQAAEIKVDAASDPIEVAPGPECDKYLPKKKRRRS